MTIIVFQVEYSSQRYVLCKLFSLIEVHLVHVGNQHMEVSTGNSWAANNWGEIKEYKNNGTLDAIYKDLTSVIAESTKNKTFVPVSDLVLNVLHSSMDSEDNQNK